MARHKLGELIAKELRKNRRSQAWLAETLKISRSTITKWLGDDGNRISADNIQKISDALHTDRNKLFELAAETWPKHKHEYLDYLEKHTEQKSFAGPEPSNGAEFKLPYITPLKNINTPIYYELKLGKEIKRKIDPKDPDEREKRNPHFPFWMERAADWQKFFDIKPAHGDLDGWLQQKGIHVVVGEPGGGKSTLLRYWANELIIRSTPTKQYLPLLVPLREVKEDGIQGFFAQQEIRFNKGFDIEPYLTKGYDKENIQVVWLFDGLDELKKDLQNIWIEQIKRRKDNCCIVTCRTALWNSDYRINFGEPHYLIGLYPKDQKLFLTQLADEWREGERKKVDFEQADEAWVNDLHSKLQSKHNLKRLAGSPLLLTMIARTNKPNHIDLPAKKVTFYQRAFKELLRQRNDDINPRPYIKVLSELAYKVSRNELVAEFDEDDFDKCTVELSDEKTAILKNSNIVKYSEDGTYQWLHQTFQEWLLAEYLFEHGGLLAAIKTYWQNQTYHEVLALLWSLAEEDEQLSTSTYLIEQGCQEIATTQNERGSGFGTLLSIINSSGDNPKKEVFKLLWQHATATENRQMAIAIANTTPQVLLLKLSRSKNEYVLQSLVENPNTPVDTLLDSKDVYVLRNLAKNPNTPVDALLKLLDSKDEYVLWALAKNPNTPVDALLKLTDSNSKFVLQSLVENPNTPVDALLKLTDSKDESVVLWALAENPNTPVDALLKLADSKDEDVLLRLAENPSTPVAVLQKLADSKDKFVLRRLAKNPNTPIDALLKLFYSKDVYVLRNLAENPNTPIDILLKLFYSKDESVLRALAENPNTPIDTLHKFAGFKDENILRGLVKNPNTPVDALLKLADSKDEDVLRGLTENPNTPVDALLKLANSKDKFVLRALAENPNTPVDALLKLADSKDEDVLLRLAENPSTPVAVLQKLADSKDKFVLRRLAKNPNTPIDALLKLFYSKDKDVLWSLPENPSIPVDTLLKLLDSKDKFVLRWLARNLNTPVDALHKFAGFKDENILRGLVKNPNTPVDALLKLADSKDEDVLRGLTENPNTPVDALLKLANSKDKDVLRSLAKNPNTPVNVLKRLAKLGKIDILRILAQNPNSCLEWF